MSEARRVHYRTCSLCEAMCGLEIEVDGNRITRIRGDHKDPFSNGHICPKAPALKELHEDPDRLRHPMRRTADGWQHIGWDQALDETAERIHTIQSRHGRNAVASYLGNPNVHNLGAMLFGPEFLRTLGTRNRYSATSVDQLPHMLVAYWMFGHQLLMPVPDLDHTQYLLVFGANPLVSNGSIMSAPNVRHRLKSIQKRGGRIVVVDPCRTETAQIADEHLFVRPGTDALVLMAMVQVLFAEDLVKLDRLADFSHDIDKVREVVRAFSPERAAGPSGIRADDIRRIVREFVAADSAVAYGRIGVSTQRFGGLCQWLINLINILTGNLDRRGGAMFTTPAFDIIGGPRFLGVGGGGFGRWRSRVRDLPEVGGELPVAALADEILEPGDGQVRGLITSAGNPVLSTPNGARLETALAQLEFMVSVDFYINETTRHANIILPPTGPLEHAHYDVIFHLLAVRNTVKYSPALFEPAPDTRHDWQIYVELEDRLHKLRGQRITKRLPAKIRERMGPEGILDLGLRFGPYGLGSGLREGLRGPRIRQLRAEPHGIDLGPLRPVLPERLPPNAKGESGIQLAPQSLLEDVARLDNHFPATASASATNGTLVLISRRQLRSNNSWMHNMPGLMTGKPRCTLLMHPDDVERLGLKSGTEVRVSSRVGSVVVPLEADENLMPGVVSLPHGFGHSRDGVRLQVAAKHAGVSVNDLTDEQLIDDLCGTTALSGVPVRVEADQPG